MKKIPTQEELLLKEIMEQLAPAEREYDQIVEPSRRRRYFWAASAACLLMALSLWSWKSWNTENVCLVRQEGQQVASPPQACQLMERQMAEMFRE